MASPSQKGSEKWWAAGWRRREKAQDVVRMINLGLRMEHSVGLGGRDSLEAAWPQNFTLRVFVLVADISPVPLGQLYYCLLTKVLTARD